MNVNGGKVGFIFHMGHGHYTQYYNFQECVPPELKDRCEWIPLFGERSEDKLANLSVLPGGMRYRRHKTWHFRQGLQRQREWDALFVASFQFNHISELKRRRCYFYTDVTRSLMLEMSPWYDHMIKNSVVQTVKERLLIDAFQHFEGFFCMSNWSAAGVQKDYRVPKEKCHISHPGANLARWHYVDRQDRPSSRPVRILMTGGQFKLKGGDYLLQWAESTRCRNWELDIITWASELPPWVQEALGNPGNDARLSCDLAPRLPNVRIHLGIKANTPEIMSLFADADVFCLPTHADGSSIASLEAMATGLPVIVGSVGGIPELVKDGQTGFLQKRHDYDDLVMKLDRLVEDRDLRLTIGKAARQSCEDYFNVSRQVRDIFQVVDAGRAASRR